MEKNDSKEIEKKVDIKLIKDERNDTEKKDDINMENIKETRLRKMAI